jgi:tripartite-type tricarboxylate transporter receptor subunit TctC
MTDTMRCCALLVALSIGCFADAALAQAQGAGPSGYPAKPVRLYVGTGPGSLADALTRVLAAALTELWKQPVIVESRPGAGNTIAPAIVAKSPADGYTLFRCGASDAIAPALYRSLPYDHFATSRCSPVSA